MKKTLPFFITFALVCWCAGLSAQTTVKVLTTGNTTNSYTFSQEGGIYFSDGQIVVKSNRATTAATFSASDVKNMQFYDATSGIADADGTLTATLSPNPATDRITVSGIGDTPATVTIWSVSGLKMSEQLCSDNSTIDISQLPKGLYIVRIGMQTSKFVKH